MSCPTGSDRAFGPSIDARCRFDFTLAFEDTFFVLIPAIIFICSTSFAFTILLRKQDRFSVYSRSLLARVIVLSALFVLQALLLGLRCGSHQWQTETSIAADTLALTATLVAVGLVVLTFQRSLRSSTLLTLYLSALTLLGVARARTCWLIHPGSSVAATQTATVALSFFAVVLECFESPRAGSAAERKLQPPELYSGFWNRTIFAWLASTLRVGYMKIISLDDIPQLDSRLSSQQLSQKLGTHWRRYDRKERHSLLRACFWSNFVAFLSGIIPRLCLTAFTFAQPFLINTTVEYVGLSDPDKQYRQGLIGAWALVFMGLAASNSIFQYQSTRFVTQVKGGVTALIYEESLHVKETTANTITAVTLMGTDVQRIAAGLSQLHDVWACILDMGIAVWLLERQLSLACIAPVVVVLVFVGATFLISGSSNKAQQKWIEKIQERIRVTSEILDDVKSIKMTGLTQAAVDIIQDLRRQEIKTSEKFRKLLSIIVLLSNTATNLAPVATFGVYVIISVYWQDGSLLTAQAFTSLSLVSLLAWPVAIWIQAFPQAVQCIACFDRIQDYCNYSESHEPLVNGVQLHESPLELQDLTSRSNYITSRSTPVVCFENQSFSWKSSQSATLKDLNVSIYKGTITALVGPIGSGKTTFLSSVLGETLGLPRYRPTCRLRIAYCAQQPWLNHASIRANILATRPFERKWFDTVVNACGLEHDFALLPRGDETMVGSKGLTLSGGQKQRVALARAVYSRHKLIILDDVFSGMDTRTVELVSSKLLGLDGLFRKYETTVILATHNRQVVTLADTAITLENGCITGVDRPQKLVERIIDGNVIGLDDRTDSIKKVTGDQSDVIITSAVSSHSDDVESQPSPDILSADLRRKNGDLSVYKYYIVSTGLKVVALYIVATLIWMFCTEFPTVWLKWWAEANTIRPNNNVGMYMGVFATFGIVGCLSACFTAWFGLIVMISNIAARMHTDLLNKVMGAPFHFFASTSTGELLNRFSQDMELIDMALPTDVVNFTTTATDFFAKTVILLVFSKYLGAGVPIIGAALYFLQRFYLQTSRQVRLLGIEAQAPLYTHFTESSSGAVTIRAFGWESAFNERNCRLVDTSQRPSYLLSCIQHWLAFMLDTLVAVIAVVTATVVILWKDQIGAGSAGVALVMLVGFNEVLARLIKSWTSMESSIGAVARVKRFLDDTESESVKDGDARYKAEWPSSGTIEFKNVVACHRLGLDPVLKGITLKISAGDHVAICGRSGSGKTSLVLCLLHMLHVQSGQIVVDGVDISEVDCSFLRSNVSVVSQDVLHLPGSMRFNIDPSGGASELDMISALQKVGLWNLIQTQGGLDEPMNVTSWSAGQKQLLCLARAMVKTNQILILDEAASNVDHETEVAMQDIIDHHFKSTTVLSVMHRLDHILQYDKVLVMDSGSVSENGEFSESATLLHGVSLGSHK